MVICIHHFRLGLFDLFLCWIYPDIASAAAEKAGDAVLQLSSQRTNMSNIQCFECGREIAATKFAPHLERCLGMGRTSRHSGRKFFGYRYFMLNL